MTDRLGLQALLVAILGSSEKVYYQQPSNVAMRYPCIRYELDDIDIRHAGNRPYTLARAYSITYISPDPDGPIVDALAMLPSCSFERHYTAENLHHYVYNIFY